MSLLPNEFVTGECRLSYVTLDVARAINGVGAPQYSLKILIPKTDTATLTDLKKAMEAAKANGVTEGKKPFKSFSEALLATMRVNLDDGDVKFPDNPECAGHWCLNAKTPQDKPPGILNEKKERVTNPTDIYSGMYGKVHVQLYPYDIAGNRGVGVSLQNVMKTKDGDPLGGSRKKAEDVFGAPDSPFDTPAAVGADTGPLG